MKFFCLIILLANVSFSQNISTERLEEIVNLVITNSPDISNYIYPEELEISNRLGISYQEKVNKFFIANEFPKTNGITDYDFKINSLEDNFSLLTISIPSQNNSQEYYLKDSSIASKPFYYSRNWKVKASNHFKFFISDETLFNNYSIDQLEKFVDTMFDVLKFSEQQKREIKQKKIYYLLCQDEEEIKKVTGFATRGIYILAQDYVVTTYNTHYHELVHFLINYKLKELPLYTHPFWQEGLAVTFGGRGGLDAHTISEMGVFLIKSGFANHKDLLSKLDFQKTDASISYSISGLYTDFLIKNIGIDNYLKLYRKYSGTSDKVLSEKINEEDLLSVDKWNLFIDSLSSQNPVMIKKELSVLEYEPIAKQNNFEVYKNEEEYFFRIKDVSIINSSERIEKYQSKLFNEHFPNRAYKSEKYLIIANQNEISIYNLYSNNLIGKYVASFSIPPKTVPYKDAFYEFVIKKDLFDEELTENDFAN